MCGFLNPGEYIPILPPFGNRTASAGMPPAGPNRGTPIPPGKRVTGGEFGVLSGVPNCREMVLGVRSEVEGARKPAPFTRNVKDAAPTVQLHAHGCAGLAERLWTQFGKWRYSRQVVIYSRRIATVGETVVQDTSRRNET